jgi:hypothetical protein
MAVAVADTVATATMSISGHDHVDDHGRDSRLAVVSYASSLTGSSTTPERDLHRACSTRDEVASAVW